MSVDQPLNLISIENENIEECIYNIRGQQVMLDSDVAYFFDVTVSSLNRQMRRNIERFPGGFCFQLTNKEMDSLRCQNGTTKFISFKRRYNPYAYTEEGIIALAGNLVKAIRRRFDDEMIELLEKT